VRNDAEMIPSATLRTARWATALAAGALLVAACTSDGSESATPDTEQGSVVDTGTDSEAGTDYAIAFDNPTSEDFNRLLPSEDDLLDLQPAAILNVEGDLETGDDPTSLIVSFEMESHHCYGVQAEVTESANEVIIEILTGLRAGIESASCAYGIYPYTTAVPLETPLGDRTIVPAELREPEVEVAGVTTGSQPPVTVPDGSGQDPTTTDTDPATTSPDGTGATTPPGEREGNPPPVVGAHLVGQFVEDGVEWAIDQGIVWRVISFDGVPYAEESPDDPNRISFVVERDRIVSVAWS